MADSPKTFWQFWLLVFSEPTGEPSYSRVVSFIFVIFMLMIDTINYARTGQLPEVTNLIAQGVAGNAAYMINAAKKVFTNGK